MKCLSRIPFYACALFITGGPLFTGEIEDYKGRCHVMCPWHGYMFDLKDGSNEIGLRVRTYVISYPVNSLNCDVAFQLNNG